MGEFLDRYMQGECREVWGELLRQSNEDKRPIITDEVRAITLEMMRRVLWNLETLVSHLNTSGYKFGDPKAKLGKWFGKTYSPLRTPVADVKEKIVELERLGGPVPFTLQVFWEVVGSVNFEGKWPDGDEYQEYETMLCIDPINVPSVDQALSCCKEELKLYKERDTSTDKPFSYELMFNCNEAIWWGLSLPDQRLDGLVMIEEESDYTFTDYLAASLRWGGSWYYDFIDPDAWTWNTYEPIPEKVRNIVAVLTQDLLPF